MTVHYSDDLVTVHHGDCLDILRTLPDASVDSVVTDPPYGLEFMGKEWDKFAPAVDQPKRAGWDHAASGAKIDRSNLEQPRGRAGVVYNKRRATYRCDGCDRRDAFRPEHDCPGTWQHEWTDPVPVGSLTFQAWCEAWSRECLRVLKPGGHLLAFGGTRTWHRLACAVEDAGFEVRDSIAWLYGSGFPKSLDVSKAIDKAAGATREVVGQSATVTPRTGKSSSGFAPLRQVRWGDQHYTWEDAPQEARDYFTAQGETRGQITAPATDAARQWQGWGTALKPAFEPVVVARKPLTGTVAGNVLTHGTGALNIDACRVGTTGGGNACPGGDACACVTSGVSYSPTKHPVRREGEFGRWPANVVLDSSQAAELDRQSGTLHSQNPATRASKSKTTGVTAMGTGASVEYGDTGGASRFFPTFRYEAKAPTHERPRVGAGADGGIANQRCMGCGRSRISGNRCECVEPRWSAAADEVTAHPTVKPLDLMRWLVRLVTPPGGTVLEPFAGSGTTAEACVIEGFRCIAIEREASYLPLIVARLSKPIQPDLFGGLSA